MNQVGFGPSGNESLRARENLAYATTAKTTRRDITNDDVSEENMAVGSERRIRRIFSASLLNLENMAECGSITVADVL